MATNTKHLHTAVPTSPGNKAIPFGHFHRQTKYLGILLSGICKESMTCLWLSRQNIWNKYNFFIILETHAIRCIKCKAFMYTYCMCYNYIGHNSWLSKACRKKINRPQWTVYSNETFPEVAICNSHLLLAKKVKNHAMWTIQNTQNNHMHGAVPVELIRSC